GVAVQQVVTHLVGRQVAVATSAVQVGLAQVGGGRAERTVDEQVPAGSHRAQPAGGGGATELPPPAVHLRQPVAGQGQRGGEVLLGGDLRTAALVYRRDPERGRPAQRRPLQLSPPVRVDRGQGGGPDGVVGVPAYPSGRMVAGP